VELLRATAGAMVDDDIAAPEMEPKETVDVITDTLPDDVGGKVPRDDVPPERMADCDCFRCTFAYDRMAGLTEVTDGV